MAGSLLLLLDDIAAMMDDVSVMTKVAAKKTAGVLGDDLALNAQQVAGVDASREIPVVWAVAKGSAINKLILVPIALLLSYFLPWAIMPLLMLGGAFLCFEGFEKIWHKIAHKHEADAHEAEIKQAIQNPQVDLLALEKEKIKGAVRTDFILSAEIIVISLGTVATEAIAKQFTVLMAISVIMTIGVYGLVAGIVKLDDLGIWLMLRKGQSAIKQILRKIGSGLVAGVPYLMRLLSVLGTAAMFLVGGGIVAHGIPPIHHWITQFSAWSYALNGVLGVIIGAVCVLIFNTLLNLIHKK